MEIIDPVTAKIVVQAAINMLKDKETRRRVLTIALTPVISVVLILTMAYYLLTTPLEYLSEIFQTETDVTYARALQEEYGYISDGETIDISGDYEDSEVPLFIQWDSRWGNCRYGNSDTIASSGCGPTAFAMVTAALTGDTSVNPKVMAEWSAERGYCVAGVGTSWELFPAGARNWGFRCEELSVSSAQIADRLRQGKILIASMGKGHFTNQGHFIVLRGITDAGHVLINDPNSREKSKKAWSMSIIVGEAKGVWAFGK